MVERSHHVVRPILPGNKMILRGTCNCISDITGYISVPIIFLPGFEI